MRKAINWEREVRLRVQFGINYTGCDTSLYIGNSIANLVYGSFSTL